MRTYEERGVAMISVLLVMMMVSALLIGFTTMTISDQRYRFIDGDRNQSFYAATAGLEKMTADLAGLFFNSVAPTTAQLNALAANPPTLDPDGAGPLPAISYTKFDGSTGYQISSQYLGTTTIGAGPYQGLYALITRYTMDVNARTSSSGETHLRRETETAAIPVFQFGIFSGVDLSFSAADDFDFGGRVHTNGNLFLAETANRTLWLRERVTAVGDVVRKRLSNGVTIGSVNQTGTVNINKGDGTYRHLDDDEGSVLDGPCATPDDQSCWNEPTWSGISLGTYSSWLRNGRTGATALNLPLMTVGGSPVDVARRPAPGESATNPTLLAERMFVKASLRILLSDLPNDITSLPTVSPGTASLEAGTTYGGRPTAESPGLQTATVANGSSTTEIMIQGGLPAFFKIPATFTVQGSTATNTNVTCTRKNATQLLGCNNVPAHNAGALVTMTVPAGAGTIVVTGTTTNTNTAGNNKTLTFAANVTAQFSPTTFWVNDTAAVPNQKLVTCTGYDTTTNPQKFTGCTGLTAAPPAGRIVTTGAKTDAGISPVGGVIKIERQAANGVWTDVTAEILSYGISGPSLSGSNCTDPTPNAIIRLQRLRDTANDVCTVPTNNPNDYWPNALFDAREAISRDTAPADGDIRLGGVMHHVTIDVRNLALWFRATGAAYAGSTGTDSKLDNGGYTVYFSDRRNNRNAASQETGEYGYEDFVNPGVAGGPPNGSLDPGEDINGNNQLDVYGAKPNYNGVYSTVPPGAIAPLTAGAGPNTPVARSDAQVNRAILFRRALKLANAKVIRSSGAGQPNLSGLTVVAENPVYMHGDWNEANCSSIAANNFTGEHAATSVIADTVAVLSNQWNDNDSFASPYSANGRPRAADSCYRVAIISGKGRIFPKPGDVAGGSTFGTDGGAHSFLRMLEGGGNTTVHYKGSMATLYYNRQAVGPFKCCGGVVYAVPERQYSFDTDFLNPALLPPNTPMFRDIYNIGFSQETRPGR